MSARTKRPYLLLIVALILGACHAPTTGSDPLPDWQHLPAQVLVKFQSDTSSSARKILRARYHVQSIDTLFPGVERWHLVAGTAIAPLVQKLDQEPSLAFVQPNYVRHTLSYSPSIDTSQQWGLNASQGIDAPAAWAKCATNPPGKGAVVAVVDTGVDTSHPDLRDNIPNDPSAATSQPPWGKKFIDEVGDDTTPYTGTLNFKNMDGYGHGTHVAGILGGMGASSQTTGAAPGHLNPDGATGTVFGVAPGVTILPVKTMHANGDGDDFTIAKGLRDAADAGADVINLSVGGPAPSPILADALAYDFSKDVTVVIAAGNSGTNVFYPAAYAGVIAVGAVTAARVVPSYSNSGPQLALMAPGGDSSTDPTQGIFSTLPTYPCYVTMVEGEPMNYGVQAGTSMATPFVTGAAALVIAEAKAQGYHLTPAQVRMRLLASATPLGSGFSKATGFGLVNPASALSWGSNDGVGP